MSAFTLHVPDADIADLRDRLARTRWPDSAPGDPWAYGASVDYLRDLVGYWRDGFDWRAQEAKLSSPNRTSTCIGCMSPARGRTRRRSY
jgi:microsomal epoxide hydrolase